MTNSRSGAGDDTKRKQYGFVADLIFDPVMWRGEKRDGMLTEKEARDEMEWLGDLLGRLEIYGGFRLVWIDNEGESHDVK